MQDEDRKKLICLLEALADEDCNYEEYTNGDHIGVCDIVDCRFGAGVRNDLQAMMFSWPEADIMDAGVGYFIVPHPEYSSGDAFGCHGMWEGEYGDARRRLCVWLVEELKKGDIDGN